MEALTEKKQRELRAFAAACEAGLPILAENVVPGEKPDLRVTTANGIVGIELSEILPLPRNASFNSSLAEASLQEDSVRLAEQAYYAAQDAMPVQVTVYPWDVERTRNKKREIADALASFVKSHRHEAAPVKLFERIDGIPEGFGVVNICSTPGPWRSENRLSLRSMEYIISFVTASKRRTNFSPSTGRTCRTPLFGCFSTVAGTLPEASRCRMESANGRSRAGLTAFSFSLVRAFASKRLVGASRPLREAARAFPRECLFDSVVLGKLGFSRSE